MTAPAAETTLTEDVIALLADRVPSRVLDRVLLDLLDNDPAQQDHDLRQLLERGLVSGSLRTISGTTTSPASHLIGVRTREPERLLSRLRLHAEAYRQRLRMCMLDTTCWILAPEASRAWVEQALLQPGMPDLLALVTELDDPRLGPSCRATLDELLDVGERRCWRGVFDTRRLETARRVEALLDLTARQPGLMSGPLDALLDASGGRSLLETLYAWFQSDQDVAATAQRMHLHVNTVRYRIRRAQELSGLDLSDWDQRLLAQLQLRAWRDALEPT